MEGDFSIRRPDPQPPSSALAVGRLQPLPLGFCYGPKRPTFSEPSLSNSLEFN